jgi:PIN domain nuclease of toxin-antitoxin system
LEIRTMPDVSVFGCIGDPGNEVRASAVSAWEFGIKMTFGKLPVIADLRLRPEQAMVTDRILPLDITAAHEFPVAELPVIHRDPFDELPVAQARCEQCLLVTDDRQLRRSPVDLLW